MYVRLDHHDLLRNTSVVLVKLRHPDQFDIYKHNIGLIIISVVKRGILTSHILLANLYNCDVFLLQLVTDKHFQ